jgi:5,10-methylenetetrahydromethanopterin reductase
VLEPGESAIPPRALKQTGPLAMLPFHTYACYPEIGALLPPLLRERLEIFDKEVLARIDLPRELLYQDINAGHLEHLLDGEAAVLTEEMIGDPRHRRKDHAPHGPGDIRSSQRNLRLGVEGQALLPL